MIGKEHLAGLLESRGRLRVTVDGNDILVESASGLEGIDGVIESVSDVYPPWIESLEERKAIKRKYGAHPPIHINEGGPVRNAVIEFVGNRFVTKGELDDFMNKVDEGGGKKPHYKKWFKRNGRYFGSVTVKGEKLLALSKLGRRVFEHILARQSKNEATMSFCAWQLERELNESMRAAMEDGDLLESSAQDKLAKQIETDISFMRMDGKRPDEVDSWGSGVRADWRHLGRWEHDEERGREQEEDGDMDWREDDDQMRWAPGEYKRYMEKFTGWAKTFPWFSKVSLALEPGEKNWVSFQVILKRDR